MNDKELIKQIAEIIENEAEGLLNDDGADREACVATAKGIVEQLKLHWKIVPAVEPVWEHEPTHYIHWFLIRYGLQSPDGWGDADWDEENLISALEDVIKRTVHPRDFIRRMHVLVVEDKRERESEGDEEGGWYAEGEVPF